MNVGLVCRRTVLGAQQCSRQHAMLCQQGAASRRPHLSYICCRSATALPAPSRASHCPNTSHSAASGRCTRLDGASPNTGRQPSFTPTTIAVRRSTLSWRHTVFWWSAWVSLVTCSRVVCKAWDVIIMIVGCDAEGVHGEPTGCPGPLLSGQGQTTIHTICSPSCVHGFAADNHLGLVHLQ